MPATSKFNFRSMREGRRSIVQVQVTCFWRVENFKALDKPTYSSCGKLVVLPAKIALSKNFSSFCNCLSKVMLDFHRQGDFLEHLHRCNLEFEPSSLSSSLYNIS